MQDRPTPLETRYGKEIAVMTEMGWSWSDLESAPFDLVEEIAIRLDARAHWENERTKLDKAKSEQQRNRTR
jgi:hypothetical protein